jgi:CheY-like chemotaxis protein
MVTDCIEMVYPDYKITKATNGFAALCQIQNQPKTQNFDVIITGYKMPVMNGLDLAHTVRQTWPDTRIIFMTGSADSDKLEKKAAPLNLDAFMLKPFSMKELFEVIELN